MSSYLKSKKIEIYRTSGRKVDEDGFPLEEEGKIHSGKLWAYYRHSSSKEYWAAQAAHYQEDAIFIISYRNDIDPLTDYILYNGQRFDINGVDDYEGGRHDIKISARYHK